MFDNFGSDFSKAFFGSDHLRDFKHGSKVFREDNYALAPRQKFLFHVVFNFNTAEIPQLSDVFKNQRSVSLLVKTAQLPTYQVDVEEMNQYNRKRLIQKKITYQPVQITFHDDGSDIARKLWYNYFSYHYNDPTHGYNTGDRNNFTERDVYDDVRFVDKWGYSGDSVNNGVKPAFFKDITIYGLNQKKYASYILINPMITDWVHDTYDYSQSNDTVGHTMTIRYETVKYCSGDPKAITGFGDSSHYDSEASGLARGGTSASILGPGGLLNAAASIATDLQDGSIGGILNAVRTAGTAANTFKGKDLGGILKSEATGFLAQTAQETLRGNTAAGILNTKVSDLVPSMGGFSFPTSMSSGIEKVKSIAKPADLLVSANIKKSPPASASGVANASGSSK